MDMSNESIAELDENTMAEMILGKIEPENLFHHPSGTYIFDDHWKPIGKEQLNNRVRKEIALLNRQRKKYGHKPEKITLNRVKSVAELLKMAAFREDVQFNSGPTNIVSVENGDLVLDGEDWQLCKPLREHHRIARSPVKYDPTATAPQFQAYLESLFDGEEDAEDKANLLLKMMGLALMTDTRFERFLILLGMGGNGKSVFLELLRKFVGARNTAAVHPMQFENTFHRQHMDGKLVNIVTESPQGFKLPTADVKALVSGEAMTVEKKHQDPYVIKPFATLFWSTNHLPHPSDYSNALYRRTFILDFNHSFEGRADDQLGNKLSPELSGVLNMVLKQLAKLLNSRDFEEPLSSKLSRDRWRVEGDQARLWLQERTERHLTEYVGVTDAFLDYAEWAKEQGYHKVMNRTSFNNRLEAAQIKKIRRGQGVVWTCLRLKR